tara:strand:- start:8 stop:658 length:651 start_codon:yes stop_codon:yes gene_type:complete
MEVIAKNTGINQFNISNARKNEILLKHPKVQNIELFNSPIGEIIRTSAGEDILPNGEKIGGKLTSVKRTKPVPEVFQLEQDGSVAFYDSVKKKLYGWWPLIEQHHLGFSIILLKGRGKREWYFIDLDDLRNSQGVYLFDELEEVDGGLFFLKEKVTPEGKSGRFINIVDNFKKSPMIENLEHYYRENGQIVCLSSFGSAATVKIKNMKLSPWQFPE